MSKNQQKKWFPGIDSLRAVMALIVMFGHLKNVYSIILKHSPNKLFKLIAFILSNTFVGVAAVIAFFIISGFVIHYPNKKGITNIKTFWVRRLVRVILPLMVVELIGWKYNNPQSAVVWSLYCELIYYTIYPLLSTIKISWKTKVVISFVISIIAIILLAPNDLHSFLAQKNLNYNGNYWQAGLAFTWLIGLPCWLLGVYLADIIDSLQVWFKYRTLVTVRIAVGIISSCCLIARFHFFLSYILSLNILAIVMYHWLKMEVVYYKEKKAYALLEGLGKFSYSIYLCHLIFYTIISQFLNLNALTYPIFLILTLSLSYLFFLIIEKPSQKLAQKISKAIG